MKQMYRFLGVAILLLALLACTKQPTAPTIPAAIFSADLDGQGRDFTDYTIAISRKNTSTGKFDLYIVGEKGITSDSSTQIRFMVPDFTLSDTLQKTYTLNTNFTGNFIEWKITPASTHGAYHFFQTGQLTIQKKANDVVEGSFNFVYFTFDRFAQKTGEYHVSNGQFKNLKIARPDL
ncbi:MAG: hypothetical protein GXC72_13890 [Chitinophagaceae bacterium]|nr:hypothetical protein [Chitinophagaceae bacterium]